MEIALTSNGSTIDDSLDLRLGRCPYFIIYDLDSDKYRTLDNRGESSSGGAGIAAAQQLIDEKVEAVITGSVGPNAYELLESSRVRIYKGEEISCSLLIDKYKKGELKEIGEAGPKHRGGF